MAVRATGINPEMLRWARERSGYTVEDIARRRRVPPERVLQWEAGKSFPTWRQLEQLAYQDYHRGTLFFLLNAPPDEKTVADEFPRLPSALLADLHPDTLYAVRQARVRQEDLEVILGPEKIAERFILRDLPAPAGIVDSAQLAMAVRQYLDGTAEGPETRRRGDDTFSAWRRLIEDAGIWVFKRSFKQKDVAGFCLGHDVYPVIYLNYGQDEARQIFTLFNQLAHLLFGFNHLERTYKWHCQAELSPNDSSVEAVCRKFAKEFTRQAGNATGYCPDAPSAYEALGRKYIRAAFMAFDEGRIDELELASFLGVRGIHLDKLAIYAWQS